MLMSVAGMLRAPISNEYLIEAQPFSSYINTLLSTVTANNALQGWSTNMELWRFCCSSLLLCGHGEDQSWRRAAAPQSRGTRAARAPSWESRAVQAPSRSTLGSADRRQTVVPLVPLECPWLQRWAGQPSLPPVSMWACRAAALAKRGPVPGQLVWPVAGERKRGPFPPNSHGAGEGQGWGKATGNPCSGVRDGSGGKALQMEIKRCFWELV